MPPVRPPLWLAIWLALRRDLPKVRSGYGEMLAPKPFPFKKLIAPRQSPDQVSRIPAPNRLFIGTNARTARERLLILSADRVTCELLYSTPKGVKRHLSIYT